MPLLHRCSRAPADFRRPVLAATNDASRLRGFDLCEAAFFRSGYSPRPKPLPSSRLLLLQVLALSPSAPSYSERTALDVTSVGLRFRAHRPRSSAAYCHRETLAISSPSSPTCSSFRTSHPKFRVLEFRSRYRGLAAPSSIPCRSVSEIFRFLPRNSSSISRKFPTIRFSAHPSLSLLGHTLMTRL
jgi:hypothetical protein